MDQNHLYDMYDFRGKVAVVTGGAGILCADMCRMLASAGAHVAILDLKAEAVETHALQIRAEDGSASGIACDALSKDSVDAAAAWVMAQYGKVDFLINGVGGNKPQATTSAEVPFFDLPADALRWVFDLNLVGAILPCQAFGRHMAAQKQGVILNISSMNAYRPLTRIPAYSAAKAAVSNFTQFMAVHFADVGIRVNAIAPGFFSTNQNKTLLFNEDGSLTARSNKIITHTPLRRFGVPEDLTGALLFLCDESQSGFITGVILPVDGGFSAYSGV